MNPEKRPNREEQRDDPSAMWAHLGDHVKFRGHVAEQEQPKTYLMRVATGFTKSKIDTIDPQKWELWFRDKDNGVNKDETYYRKVMQAIETWNSTPLTRASCLSQNRPIYGKHHGRFSEHTHQWTHH